MSTGSYSDRTHHSGVHLSNFPCVSRWILMNTDVSRSRLIPFGDESLASVLVKRSDAHKLGDTLADIATDCDGISDCITVRWDLMPKFSVSVGLLKTGLCFHWARCCVPAQDVWGFIKWSLLDSKQTFCFHSVSSIRSRQERGQFDKPFFITSKCKSHVRSPFAPYHSLRSKIFGRRDTDGHFLCLFYLGFDHFAHRKGWIAASRGDFAEWRHAHLVGLGVLQQKASSAGLSRRLRRSSVFERGALCCDYITCFGMASSCKYWYALLLLLLLEPKKFKNLGVGHTFIKTRCMWNHTNSQFCVLNASSLHKLTSTRSSEFDVLVQWLTGIQREF